MSALGRPHRNEIQDQSAPRNVDALVLVDISPRFLYGHTREDALPNDEYREWTVSLGRLTRRLHAVALFLEEHATPLITIESGALNWLRAPHQRMTLALAGLYGDWCVRDMSVHLRKRGHAVIVAKDLCVWEHDPVADYPVPVCSATDLWPGLGKWIADSSDPVHWDGQPLFTFDEQPLSPLDG
jgi:hypothetical protein